MVSPPNSKFQHRGGLSFAFLCLFSCMVVYMVLLKCVELKCVAFYLPCARFILFVVVVLLVTL